MTSTDRTPTTDEVRSGYSYYTSGYWHEETEEGTAEFNRWLAFHDAEVRRIEPSDAQIDAGARALFFEYYGNGWADATDADVEICRSNARAVLRAASTSKESA